jgi:hypothetical protein
VLRRRAAGFIRGDLVEGSELGMTSGELASGMIGEVGELMSSGDSLKSFRPVLSISPAGDSPGPAWPSCVRSSYPGTISSSVMPLEGAVMNVSLLRDVEAVPNPAEGEGRGPEGTRC